MSDYDVVMNPSIIADVIINDIIKIYADEQIKINRDFKMYWDPLYFNAQLSAMSIAANECRQRIPLNCKYNETWDMCLKDVEILLSRSLIYKIDPDFVINLDSHIKFKHSISALFQCDNGLPDKLFKITALIPGIESKSKGFEDKLYSLFKKYAIIFNDLNKMSKIK